VFQRAGERDKREKKTRASVNRVRYTIILLQVAPRLFPAPKLTDMPKVDGSVGFVGSVGVRVGPGAQ